MASSQLYIKFKNKEGWCITIKEITKEEMDVLVARGIIINSSGGFHDKRGNVIGFYRTRNKRYIEDKYQGIARKYLK